MSGCSTTEPVELLPYVEVSPEAVALAPASVSRGASIGIEVEANESDSLDDLEVLPGARVRSVVDLGPAARAGLEPGDVILSVNGVETNDADSLRAAIERSPGGAPLELEVRRGTTVFRATALAGVAPDSVAPREIYRIDPIRVRAAFRTELAGTAGEERATAAIVKLFPRSPLPGAGLRPGDRIVALDGRPVASAQGLVRRLIEEHAPGETIEIEFLRDGESRSTSLALFEPERSLTKLAALPLFRYESAADGSETKFSLLDFWILSLFSYERDEGEREYALFSIFRFATGRGELVEEPAIDTVVP